MNGGETTCRYIRRNFMNRGENICRYIRSLRFHTSCKCECAPSVGMVDTNCSVIDFQKIKMEKHWEHWTLWSSSWACIEHWEHWELWTLNIVIFQLGPALDIEMIEHWEHRTLCFSSVGLYWSLDIENIEHREHWTLCFSSWSPHWTLRGFLRQFLEICSSASAPTRPIWKLIRNLLLLPLPIICFLAPSGALVVIMV